MGNIADNVRHYPIRSIFQRTSGKDGSPVCTDLRILIPASGVNRRTRFLYVLPVQAGTPATATNWARQYGDGISVMERLDVSSACNLIIVEANYIAPGPAPWYADHPGNPAIRQESYLIKEIVPMADAMFPLAARVRLLLGFSKSGWGAISLILRHPELFRAAAAWDAPLMMRHISPANYEGEDVVFGGDNDYFDAHYRLDARLDEAAAVLRNSDRLWIGVNPRPANTYEQDFARQSVDFSQALMKHGIKRTVHIESSPRPHTWEPSSVNGTDYFWQLNAINFLVRAAPVAQ